MRCCVVTLLAYSVGVIGSNGIKDVMRLVIIVTTTACSTRESGRVCHRHCDYHHTSIALPLTYYACAIVLCTGPTPPLRCFVGGAAPAPAPAPPPAPPPGGTVRPPSTSKLALQPGEMPSTSAMYFCMASSFGMSSNDVHASLFPPRATHMHECKQSGQL